MEQTHETTITIRLPVSMRWEIERAAADGERTVSQQARLIFRDWITGLNGKGLKPQRRGK